jgi:amino acid adenylation domain-containing protein
MRDSSKQQFSLPPEQQTSRDNYISPSQQFAQGLSNDVDSTTPTRFETVVRHYPDRLAIKVGNRALTYNELNKAANRIARAILAIRGPGNEPIALLFEHGIDVIAALFGTLKAGKFNVAMSPSFPVERNKYMFEDSGARLIVTNSLNLRLAHALANDNCKVFSTDEISAQAVSDDLALAVSPDSLVHIRYTSGSTGQPKGVTKDHRNNARAAIDANISIDDRFSLLHEVSFGSSSNHLYSSLLNGASLFPFDIKSAGIDRLAAWLRDEQITVCHLPPAVFRQLADVLSSQEHLPHLRMIRLSGAPITRLDFDLYKSAFSPRTLLKIDMGSSETGRISSAVLDHSFNFPNEGTAAGYPRAGKKILLLDENGHEVEPTQIGEIAVKGRGLASGYWQRPELTSAKFRTDPSDDAEPIYLTGDLGRIRADGFLIHLGRKDFMVKIRGYRVELGEIENTLVQHPMVKEAAAVAWDYESGEKYLAAYVVPQSKTTLTIGGLREFVKSKLPSYMVPAVFIILDTLPLMNGKVDRNALPPPDHQRPNLDNPYVPPRSDLETTLVEIWELALELQPIGIHDNFLDLGGHSLDATRIISRILATLRFDLPIKALFQSPTIAEMAAILENHLPEDRVKEDLTRLLSEIEQLSDSEVESQISELELKKV